MSGVQGVCVCVSVTGVAKLAGRISGGMGFENNGRASRARRTIEELRPVQGRTR